MSRRKANLDHEFALEREIKDLKEEIAKLKKKLRSQEKDDKLEMSSNPEPVKKAVSLKKIAKPCPDCGEEIKVTDLPHATMELCSKGCGYRKVRNK
jgi:predicted RNase H-like nuclease (RuvC/YqgF family)